VQKEDTKHESKKKEEIKEKNITEKVYGKREVTLVNKRNGMDTKSLTQSMGIQKK
jgi:hypothetical protein